MLVQCVPEETDFPESFSCCIPTPSLALLLGGRAPKAMGAAGCLLLEKNPLVNQGKAIRPPSQTPGRRVTVVFLGPATTQNLVVKFDGEIFSVENASDDFPSKRSSKISSKLRRKFATNFAENFANFTLEIDGAYFSCPRGPKPQKIMPLGPDSWLLRGPAAILSYPAVLVAIVSENSFIQCSFPCCPVKGAVLAFFFPSIFFVSLAGGAAYSNCYLV